MLNLINVYSCGRERILVSTHDSVSGFWLVNTGSWLVNRYVIYIILCNTPYSFQVLICVPTKERYSGGALNVFLQHRVHVGCVRAPSGDGRLWQRGVPRGRLYSTVCLVLWCGEFQPLAYYLFCYIFLPSTTSRLFCYFCKSGVLNFTLYIHRFTKFSTQISTYSYWDQSQIGCDQQCHPHASHI